jgi:isoquinoline 1-oxidoreductase subunit alpha
MAKYNLSVNNKKYSVEAEPDTPLLWAIRDYIGLKGTKFGCGMGMCGACTVHINGEATRSCQQPVGSLPKNTKIITIEGVGATTLNAIQNAWIEFQVPQCGYCQSGQIMTATALLKSIPKPTDSEIDDVMQGNLCRCGTYDRIKKAIHKASESI